MPAMTHPPAAVEPGSAARVLTMNVGSSSVKFAFFTGGEPPERALSGGVERLGSPGTTLGFKTAAGQTDSQPFPSDNPESATRNLLDRLAIRPEFSTVTVVAHRLVHGGPNLQEPQRVTPELLDELQRLAPMDPDHLPAEIGMIRTFGERFPGLPQVACFDTAFHATLPRVARLLPIPRHYEAWGVRRYGFHGLSYEFLLGELRRLDGEAAANGRVILAHLGNGASIAAVRDGRCLDTSMGFTPAAGLPMSTRSGDLDPGLFPYLARTEGMTAEGFNDLVNHHSGLLGISETSSDVRDLLAAEADDPARRIPLPCSATRRANGSAASPPPSAGWTRLSSPAASGKTPRRSAPEPAKASISSACTSIPPGTHPTPPGFQGPTAASRSGSSPRTRRSCSRGPP